MSSAPAATEPAPSRTGIVLDGETLAWAAIILLAALLRFIDLGAKPLHHDESIHAFYSWKIFREGFAAYRYDPTYHGPFLYHANALVYFLFGASDFTCRLMPAACGTAITAHFLAWRPLLGRRGALTAALLSAISPTFTSVSRFLRDDIYMALGVLVLVLGLFRYFEERRPGLLCWAVAGLALAFTSMEATWIFLGILVSFLIWRRLWERGAAPTDQDVKGLLADLRGPSGRALAARLAAIFLIPFTLLFSSFFTNADGWFVGAFDSLAYWLGEQKTSRAEQPIAYHGYILAFYEMPIVLLALLSGLRAAVHAATRGRSLVAWALAAVAFFLALLVHASASRSPAALILSALLLTLGAGAVALGSFRPGRASHARVFLLYWSILALGMFSLAGERMPWLALHPLTPMVLLAATLVGDLLEREPSPLEHRAALSLLALPLAYLAVLLPVQLVYALRQAPFEIGAWLRDLVQGERHARFERSGWPIDLWSIEVLRLAPLALFALALVLAPAILRRLPALGRATRPLEAALLALSAALLLHGTTSLVFHDDGASPAEPHVFVQTSPEIPRLVRGLEDLSRRLAGGKGLEVAVEDSAAWPLCWYLRDFPNAHVGYPQPLKAERAPRAAVLITGLEGLCATGQEHDAEVAASLSPGYSARRIALRRYWVPSREAITGRGVPWSLGLARLARLFIHREPWPDAAGPVGAPASPARSPVTSQDVTVWVRRDLDPLLR